MATWMGHTFFSQSPVGLSHDILFKLRPEIGDTIDVIVSQILAATEQGNSYPSMTFLVAGHWGAGKSTALSVIRDKLINGAKERGHADVLSVSDYHAPAYEQDTQRTRAALAYEIIKSANPAVMDLVLDGSLENLEGGSVAALEMERAARFYRGFFERESNPLRIEEAAGRLLAEISGKHWTHVCFVDDVDRCSLDCTASILMAMNSWSRVDNLYFIVAADAEHLLNAVAEQATRAQREPAEALQKYIHFTLDLPSLPATIPEAAHYFTALIDRVSLRYMDMARIDEIRDLIDSAKDAGPYGPLGPVLETTGDSTPRAAKHRLNQLMPGLLKLSALTPELVKRAVIRTVWPAFYASKLDAVEFGHAAAGVRERLADTISIAASVLPIAAFGRELAHDAFYREMSKRGFDLEDVPADLALFLASAPTFTVPDDGKNRHGPLVGESPARAPESESTPADLVALMASVASRGGEDSAVGMPSAPDDPAAKPGHEVDHSEQQSFDDRMFEIHLRSEVAETESNRAEGLAVVREFLDLVTSQRDRLRARHAPTVGNEAINAENWGDMRSALVLHAMAYQLDPGHTNIAQNFCTTLLQLEDKNLLPVVKDVVRNLRSAHHDPSRRMRTIALSMGAAMLEGDMSQLDEYLVEFSADLVAADRAVLLSVIDTLAKAHRVTAIPAMVRQWLSAPGRRARDHAVVLRHLADKLASGSRDEEALATDIYVFLLRTGLALGYKYPDVDEPVEMRGYGEQDLRTSVAPILSNTAILMRGASRLDWAELLFNIAYRLRPGEARTRRAYANFLANVAKNLGDARAVQAGEAVPVPQREMSPLPNRFAPDVEHWWADCVGPANFLGTFEQVVAMLSQEAG